MGVARSFLTHARILAFLLAILQCQNPTNAATRVGFYASTCSRAEGIVTSTVSSHVNADSTIAAGILRLLFHDCFVNGCDGSILIEGSSAERNAGANTGLRGFDVIADAKKQLEAACPGVVSCADILALAARDAVVLSGGPTWSVPTGRRDGRVSSDSDAANLPAPTDSISVIKQKFAAKGLSTQDLVALNGAHTVGQTDCRFFSYRLYNFTATGNGDPTLSASALSSLRQQCPSGGAGLNQVPLDVGSRDSFDTSFFTNVRQGKGVLESDQRLNDDSSTQIYVRTFSGLVTGLVGITFKASFASSMVKMSDIGVKTGTDGEIRKICSAFN